MVYRGYHIDDDKLEKLKAIVFIEKSNQTKLILEGIDLVIEKHKESLNDFYRHIEKLKNE